MKVEDVFASPAAFRDCFGAGLGQLLQRDGLGSFILVCANAFCDPAFLAKHRSSLEQRFAELSEQYRDSLRRGQPVEDNPEDLLVWLKMMSIGFDALSLTEYRQCGPWEVQFNLLRSLRPRRMSQQAVTALHRPFDENGFHFSKPFLLPEIFWSGTLEGRAVDLYYNKYPFVDLHGLLVIERDRNAPQYLTSADHHYMWRVTAELGQALPGVGFGYNSLGGMASVNHQHFQMFVRESGLPVCDPRWRHNGGDVAYPLDCRRFDDEGEGWQFIAKLHAQHTAYNLLYLPGGLYVLPRQKQGEYQPAAWTSGFSWYELCGGFVTFNREDYHGLDHSLIAAEFARLQLKA